MSDYTTIGNFEGRLRRLQTDVAQLRSQLSSVESSLGQVATLSASVSSCREQLQRLESQFGALEGRLNSCSMSLEAIGGSLAAATKSWQKAVKDLKAECQREDQQREMIDRAFSELLAAQKRLSRLWKTGLAETAKRLQELRQREDAFREQLAAAAADFAKSIRTLDDAILAQIGGIKKEVSGLRDSEEDYLDQTVVSLKAAWTQQAKLTENLSGIDRSSQSLADHLDHLVRCQESLADSSAKQRAASQNASGLKLLACGQLKAARRCFRAVVAEWPDCFAPRFNLALAEYRLGNAGEAEMILRQLLNDFPDDRRAQLLNGLLGLLAGRADAAWDAFEPCLDGDDPVLLCGLGLACFQAGWPSKARGYLSRVAAGDHELAVALRNLPPALWGPASSPLPAEHDPCLPASRGVMSDE